MAGSVNLRNRTLMIKAILASAVLTALVTVVFLVIFIKSGLTSLSDASGLSSPTLLNIIFDFVFSSAALLFCFDIIRHCFGIRYGTILPVSFAILLAAMVFNLGYIIVALCDAPGLVPNAGISLAITALNLIAIFLMLLYYCGLISRVSAIIAAAVINVIVILNLLFSVDNGFIPLYTLIFDIDFILYSVGITLSAIYIKPVFKAVSDFDR